ncbi:MAG: lactate utilization protein C [Lapillicoccus sp.]
MTARDEVLARVRSALGPDREAATPPPDDGPRAPGPTGEALVELFIERVADYRAVVVRCPPDEVPDAVRAGLGESTSVVVPEGFPADLLGLPEGCRTVVDTSLSAADLDRVDAVVTTATVGIATTGTIVLDHGAGQGRRALSLVPDRHVCVVRSDQVVCGVSDAVSLLQTGDVTRPLTWISGPSATSDIELDRVEGVHGPRTLHVIVVGVTGPPAATDPPHAEPAGPQ